MSWTLGVRSPRSGKVLAVAHLTDAVGLELRNKIAQLVANSARMAVTVKAGPKCNPQSRYHNEHWSVSNNSGHVADLFMPKAWALRVAGCIADMVGTHVSVNAAGCLNNPKLAPAAGQLWQGPGGQRARVLVAGKRVQVANLDRGDREWLDRHEFLATWKPARTHVNRRPPRNAAEAALRRAVARGTPIPMGWCVGTKPPRSSASTPFTTVITGFPTEAAAQAHADSFRELYPGTPVAVFECDKEPRANKRHTPSSDEDAAHYVPPGIKYRVVDASTGESLGDYSQPQFAEYRRDALRGEGRAAVIVHVFDNPSRSEYARRSRSAVRLGSGNRKTRRAAAKAMRRMQVHGAFEGNAAQTIHYHTSAGKRRRKRAASGLALQVFRSGASFAWEVRDGAGTLMGEGGAPTAARARAAARRVFPGVIGHPRANARRAKRKLDTFQTHRLAIARRTLQMSDLFARIMGGMTKDEARAAILELTGKAPRENPASEDTQRKVFGMTASEMEGYLTEQVVRGDWRMLAASMVSDAQALAAMGRHEDVRQLLNRVKWVIFEKWPRDNPRTNPADSILDAIAPGDRVTILVPAGIGRDGPEYKPKTGRAVMRGPHGWVLNMGGPYGTPGVATAQNIVKVSKAKGAKSASARLVMGPRPNPGGQTLRQWSERAGIDMRKVKGKGGPYWVPDTFTNPELRAELWHLSDYAVSSVSGGTIYLVRRARAKREPDRFTKGQRVQLHPATSEWMQGDRYGEVVGLGRAREYYDTFSKARVMARPVRVKLDKSGRVRRFHPDNVMPLDNPRSSSDEARALQVSEMWHENKPGRARRMKAPARVPTHLAGLGALRSVVYESDKYAGSKDNPTGGQQLYEHKFHRPYPWLASDGQSLFVVGGKVKVTPDGLVN